MGEYQKTHAIISDLKKRKRDLLKKREKLEAKIDEINENIDAINEQLNNCENYLSELDYIDNGDGFHDITRGL